LVDWAVIVVCARVRDPSLLPSPFHHHHLPPFSRQCNKTYLGNRYKLQVFTWSSPTDDPYPTLYPVANSAVGPVAQSVWRLATGWTVRGSNPGGGEIFRTCPDRPWGPPSFLYNGYRVFPGGRKRPGCDADRSPPSSAEV
jgi:hypothetical protein